MHNVFSKEEKTEITRLVNVWGAFIYDSFIPNLTSHIITNTPDKDLIGKAGSVDNTTGPFIVTKQWLVDSILAGKREDERRYLPKTIDRIHNPSGLQTFTLQKKNSKYIFGTLFKKEDFSFVEDSYSADKIEELTEKIEGNSGRIINERVENHSAKYMIVNDGHNSWEGFKLERNKDNKYVVSHRFIDRWLLHKKMINIKKLKAIDLLPFPHSIPYPNFSQYWVAFTLFPKNRDLPVLENLADLMGMRVEFSEENTTHLVYCNYDANQGPGGKENKEVDLSGSSKIQIIKRTFTEKVPYIVKFDWFLNCILNGRKEDETSYMRDLNSI